MNRGRDLERFHPHAGTMTAAVILCSLGHYASTAQLLDAGASKRALAALVASGAAERPRKGLLVCAHLPALQRQASRLGGRVDCVSVLRDHGIWAADDYRLHVRVPANGQLRCVPLLSAQGHAESASPRGILLSDPSRGVVRHWGGLDAVSDASSASVSVMEALHQAMGCLAPDDLVAALESAVYRRAITLKQLAAVIEAAPRRLRAALRELEVGAQSGVETLVRLGFRRLGYRVEPQAFVPGVGHVDNLIEDCVAVESDGRSYHEDTLETDYDRDMASEYMGVRVLRVSPRIVRTKWAWLVETVARMVRGAGRRG